MEGLLISALGTAGAVLSTISLMPQVVHTWRTRSAADISAAWLVMAIAATVIWMIYGNLIDAQPVIWTNAICFAQCAYILFIKLRTQRITAAGQP